MIVIGSGAAGLTAALALAEHRRVLVLAKGTLTGGSTAWAQGGIAAVLDEGDTFEHHIRATMIRMMRIRARVCWKPWFSLKRAYRSRMWSSVSFFWKK